MSEHSAPLWRDPLFSPGDRFPLGPPRGILEDCQEGPSELATPDGSSWAVIHHTPDDNGHSTQQAGPRRLWSELEQLYEQWIVLGRPDYHRFGLTHDRNSQTLLWLDHPDIGHTWHCGLPAPTTSGARA